MMTTLALLAVLQAPCAPDCPTTQAHIESVAHTQGKACPSCAVGIDVCFRLCRACAAAKGVCRGCGGQALDGVQAWKGGDGKPGIRLIRTGEEWDGAPEIDFSKWAVVSIVQGVVLESEKARLVSVREFDDRVVVTYSTRTAQCGSEPRAFDALRVRVPRASGKKWVIQHVRHELFRGPKISIAAEFAPRG